MAQAIRTPSMKDLRVLATAFAVLFLVVATWLWFRSSARALWPALAAAASAFFAVAAVAKPALIAPIYRPWMIAGQAMSRVMTFVLLSVFYFVLLLPFTLIRLGDPLRRKRPAEALSFFERYPERPAVLERYRRPY